MKKQNNNLNFTFAGIFFVFGLMLFGLWWFRGIFTLPAAIIFLVIGIILIIINSKANAKRNAKRR